MADQGLKKEQRIGQRAGSVEHLGTGAGGIFQLPGLRFRIGQINKRAKGLAFLAVLELLRSLPGAVPYLDKKTESD